jgi:hypothetical protein|tara:strand:+ start:554 stop:856 length:303 start_codon:yes stop_codon:yes gene_type:complete
MARDQIVNGVRIELTAEEEAALEAQEAAWLKDNPVPSDLQLSLDNLRLKRNSLLAETDWWGVSDNTMTDAQKKYRQDLRDLTAGLDTVDKVNAVVWPTKP